MGGKIVPESGIGFGEGPTSDFGTGGFIPTVLAEIEGCRTRHSVIEDGI